MNMDDAEPNELADLNSFALPKIPNSWTWETTRQLAARDVNSLAIGPFGSNLKVSDYSDRGVPLVFVRNIRSGQFGGAAAKFVTTHKAKELAAHSVNAGDVLITKMGDPPGDACLYPDGEPQGIITADCIKWRVDPTRCEPRFFVYAINSKIGSGQISLITKGVAQQKVSLGRFARLRLPVPPLNEQRRIVEKIEELFSDLDAGVAALERAKANLKRYRAAVLKAAVEGKLTAAWRAEHPSLEPASKLLERTTAPPRPNRWSSRSRDVIPGHAALAVGPVGTPIPKGWAWSALAEVARMETGHTPSRRRPEWWDGDVAWIGIADAREHHGGVILDTFQHTNSEGLENSAARLLPPGTVCISRTASVGYVVVMGGAMATSQDFVNWIPTPAVTSDWLRIVFLADREALLRFGKGSVHKTIYFPEWLSVHVAVPPLEEQRAIAADVDEKLSQIDAAGVAIDHGLARAARLRQSILKRAFAGQLVPQDPHDEPATAMLERIRVAATSEGTAREYRRNRMARPV